MMSAPRIAVMNPPQQPAPPKLTFRIGSAPPLSARRNDALRLLLEAQFYAADLRRSVWDFAVEISLLRKTGLTSNDLRWLLCKGYVEHGREMTVSHETSRTFRRSSGLTFARRTCFVLTESGVEFAQEALTQSRKNQATINGARPEAAIPASNGNGAPHKELANLAPKWDRQRQELRVGPYLVKQFKVPAANQERILAAFEEEDWPVKIDDPLPPHCEQDPKRRLHDTINSLNRNQKHRLIRFTGDGSGQGVRWSLLMPSANGGSDLPHSPA
ncbi:MAG: hypothetical protein GXY83_12700 [Rhodopirellula sp.]|nr:hypothetical protein [Rhodopirellula sp.]